VIHRPGCHHCNIILDDSCKPAAECVMSHQPSLCCRCTHCILPAAHPTHSELPSDSCPGHCRQKHYIIIILRGPCLSCPVLPCDDSLPAQYHTGLLPDQYLITHCPGAPTPPPPPPPLTCTSLRTSSSTSCRVSLLIDRPSSS